MSRKSPLDISQIFISNKGNKYFFKDNNYKKNSYFNINKSHKYCYYKHILPEQLQEENISVKDNIVCPLIIDTEFTAYNGNINKLSIEKLKTLRNRQLIQLDRIDYLTKQNKLNGIYELSKFQNILDIDKINLEALKKIKQIPTLHLTTQVKHIFYNDAEILVNPKIKDFYEQNISKPEYLYSYYDFSSQGHIFDYLNLKGFDIEIIKSELEDKEFKKYKTCTFKLYAYFMLADLSKILQNELGADLKEAFIKRKIKQERRLGVNGFSDKWHTKRLIIINGETYRLAFDFVDLGAMQGKISYNSVLENLNMDTSEKNLLDDLKDNMFLAMFERPEEFKRYAFGDLSIYDAFKKTNELFINAYKELELSGYITEIMLTTGSTVNDLQKAVLLKHLELNDFSKESLKLLNIITKPASASNLRSYKNAKEKIKQGGCLKRQYLSKTMGGRCYNNRMEINYLSDNFSLCDIDISGAYTTIASSLDYYYGCPVILNFNSYKVTLREFFKYYNKYLIKRGYKLAVETKENKPFTIEQDLIPSWIDTRIKHQIINEGQNEQILSIMNLENTPTAIYTKELINSNLTWDELDLINTEWTKKQRDEFLDNTYLKAAIFYPKNFQCNSITDLYNNIENHNNNGKHRFTDSMPHSTIDNEDGEYSHYWYSTNFGKLIVNDIIQYRALNKKINPSLSYLYKLIGNTIYGINVSRHFDNSNIILAANITAMGRCGMWLTEKALNIYQTITDGGICELNEVIHLMGKKIDTSLFVRTYQMRNQDLSKNYKWKTKPITENGKKIEYHQGKGWLIDDVYYGCDKKLITQTSNQYNHYVEFYGKNHKKTIKQKEELDLLEDKIKELFNKINDLVINHIRKVFPNNNLFNGKFQKIKVDKNGIAIKDENNKYIYEYVTGIFKFEVKNLCNNLGFHGSADYIYENIKDETTIKMRGYDVKPNVVSWYLNNDNLIHDTDYYNEIPPINRFMNDLRTRPENVPIPRPFIKTSILKTAQFSKEYNKTWQYSDIKCGDDFMELIRIPIFTLRFKFLSLKQQKSWVRYFNKLKRRFEGLSFEIFYINNDGTINYKKMMYEIDKYISEGVMNPKKIFDKSDHLFRDIQKNQHVLNYMKLIRYLKNMVRISIIGVGQFITENSKLSKDEVTLIWKKPKYMDKNYYNSFEDVNTYSDDKAFWDDRDK